MKTTVHIPDALFLELKKLAARERTTVRALIEEGLAHVLEARNTRRDFRLRKVSFRGEGLQPQVSEGTWERIRELIYEGRGS
jgi:hypothetical protein